MDLNEDVTSYVLISLIVVYFLTIFIYLRSTKVSIMFFKAGDTCILRI